MNIMQAKRLIKQLYLRQLETRQRFSVELVSGPGLGKSESMEQVAAELPKEVGKPVGFKPFFLSTLEQPDVRGFGLPGKDKEGTAIMQYTKAPWYPRSTDPAHGILFLDEFRQAGHDVQKPAAELLLNGRVGDSELPHTWMVVAASNRDGDRSGVQRELAFITNRRIEIKITPDLDSWVSWAETKGIHWGAIAYAKANPGDVFRDEIPKQSGPFCTPRSLVKLSYLIDVLDDNLFTEAAMGLVGEGTAAKFVAFMRVVNELPDFEDIVARPDKATVPSIERPDALYAVTQMVAYRVTDETAAAAFKYIQRLPKEFQIAGVRSAIRRTKEIVRTPEISEWLQSNRDLLSNSNLLG